MAESWSLKGDARWSECTHTDNSNSKLSRILKSVKNLISASRKRICGAGEVGVILL